MWYNTMMDSPDSKGSQNVLGISPDKEREIWEHHVGLFCDRFSQDGQQVDVGELRAYLQLRLGPLFAEHAGQFGSVLRTLDHSNSTRSGIQELMGSSFAELRQQSYPDYPTFEMRFRELNQEQHGLTPLTANRMVSYGLGEYNFLYLHIQPSYSVKDKRGTIEEAMRVLAKQLKENAIQGVATVAIDSQLVEERPERWQELGFKIANDRPKLAYVSVGDFIKRWSA